MTELEQYTDTPAAPAIPPPALTGAGMAMIREYTAAMDDAHRFATAICHSPFVPAHFAKKPADTALAILYGASVGFDPMTSVQQLYVIGGKPALYARAMVAIVLAAGHDIWTEDEGEDFVTVAGRRKGSDKVTKVTWTTQLAQQAGYTKNAKYKSEPRAMLYARASGDVARRIAPDALLGLAYNVEEMQLVDETPGAQRVAATASSTKDRVRAAIAQPTAAPAEKPPAGEATGITQAQSKKLHALVGDLGLSREEKISGVCTIIGRQVESTNDLTKAEAVQVIDSLEQALADRQPAGGQQPDEDDAVDGEVVDDAADEVWQQCQQRAAEIGMNLWGLDEDFKAFSGLERADADVSALGAYLSELQGREAA